MAKRNDSQPAAGRTLRTALALLFAAGFAWASMSVSVYLLGREEKRLLSAQGGMEMAMPVIAREPSGEAVEPAEKTLTPEQIREIIVSRGSSRGEILHEPVAGQLTEEEAIDAGLAWLSVLFTGENIPSTAKRAILSTRVNDDWQFSRLEPYYSFWSVVYENGYMTADLLINAVTGQVWCAEVTRRNPDALMSMEGVRKCLYRFAEMAGVPDLDVAVCNTAENSASLMTTDQNLGAGVKLFYGQSGEYGTDSFELLIFNLYASSAGLYAIEYAQ